MKYEMFAKIYKEAIERDGKEAFVEEWAGDWLNEKVTNEIDAVYTLAHSTLEETRKKYGYSRAAFGRAYDIPVRTLEDWDAGKRSPQSYVKMMLDYALFND